MIKVRAWDKGSQQMLKPPIDTYFGLERFFGFIPEDSVLMQHTGRKDKNIWENDICTAEYRCPVCFDNEPHLLTGTIEQADNGLWMFEHTHGEIPLDCEDLEILEVIGNIHENPELSNKPTSEAIADS